MRWMWIDQIVDYAPPPEGRLVAIKNVSLAEEHLHDHCVPAGGMVATPVMPASLIIEGMAQTAGILVGSVHNFREKVILAKIVTARLDEPAAKHLAKLQQDLPRWQEDSVIVRLTRQLEARRPASGSVASFAPGGLR